LLIKALGEVHGLMLTLVLVMFQTILLAMRVSVLQRELTSLRQARGGTEQSDRL
jgi:hypothetical protein